MSTVSKWAEVDFPSSSHLYRLTPGHDWALGGVFRIFIDVTELARDPEKPHVTGFVSDEAPHLEDRLLTSELMTCLYMAFANALDDIYHAHRFIPITLISCYCMKMRVVQCILDVQNGNIEMRVSPIVDFTHGYGS